MDKISVEKITDEKKNYTENKSDGKNPGKKILFFFVSLIYKFRVSAICQSKIEYECQ